MTRIARFPLTILAALAGLLPVACSEGDADGSGIVVGFSQIGAESSWRTAETASIRGEAEARGIECKFFDAQQKQENQIKAINSFIIVKLVDTQAHTDREIVLPSSPKGI